MPITTPRPTTTRTTRTTRTPRTARTTGAGAVTTGGASTDVGTLTLREPPTPKASRSSGSTLAATRATGLTLAPGVTLKGGRLYVDGYPAIQRAALRRSGGHALVSAAARTADSGGIAKLSGQQRAALAEDLLALLLRVGPGRASLHHVATRSGAFALLEQLLRAMRQRGERPLAQKLAGALFEAARKETHTGLRVFMERRLAQLPAAAVPEAQEDARAFVRAGLAHDRPPLDKWLKGRPPTLKVLSSVQDEFWKKELSAWRRDGYTIKELSKEKAVAEKLVTDVDPPVRILIDLRCRDEDVLDGVSDRDTDVIFYTGHAQLGGVVKFGLQNGPTTAEGTKLLGFFACRSKQNLGAIERRHPGQHVLVSDEGTYGHDDQIVSHALLEGIVRGHSYARIEADAKKEGLWERNNYVMPHESGALLRVPDVYVPESKTAKGTSVSFRPKQNPAQASEIPSGPVDDAVDWLNTIHGYWAEQGRSAPDKALHDRIRSEGFFDAPDGSDRPAVRVKKNSDGSVTVGVNKHYAHQDPDALGFMISYEGGQELLKLTQPRMSDHERKMVALAMVGSYTYFLVEFSDVIDVLLKQFGRTYGYSEKLNWEMVERSVLADKENDCSPTTIAVMEAALA